MSSPRTISFRIAAEKVAQLDSIAKAMDRDRSYLLNEAVENYLSEQQRFAAMVEEGLEASRKGELIDDEDVGKTIDSWVRERASGKKRGKAAKGYVALENA
jgi:predicted transcriptional regulator